MSRIGKNPVSLPDSVNIALKGSSVEVKGPKGTLTWDVPAGIKVSTQDKSIIVEKAADTRQIRSLHGTSRSIIANMVTGVSEGFRKDFDIIGVGYRAQVQGNKIGFTLGYSHPVEFVMPEGITAEIDKKQTQLTIYGIDKQVVGQVAANIRALRPPDAYKGKGIRFRGEHIKLKAGKAGA